MDVNHDTILGANASGKYLTKVRFGSLLSVSSQQHNCWCRTLIVSCWPPVKECVCVCVCVKEGGRERVSFGFSNKTLFRLWIAPALVETLDWSVVSLDINLQSYRLFRLSFTSQGIQLKCIQAMWNFLCCFIISNECGRISHWPMRVELGSNCH